MNTPESEGYIYVSTRAAMESLIRRTLAGIEQLIHEIRLTDWEKLLSEEAASSSKASPLLDHGSALLKATLEIHHLIADGFLNHQIHMGPHIQPTLFGFKNAL